MLQRFIIAVTIAYGAQTSAMPNPEAVVDAIWSQATAADLLDHVRVTAFPEHAQATCMLLLRAPSEASALDKARTLGIRSLQAPLLRGWRLHRIDAVTLNDLLA